MNRSRGRNRIFSFLLIVLICVQIVACASDHKKNTTTAPAFTSATNATFVVGAAGTFTVTATGTPTPTLALTGALPSGVTFVAATGVLSGTAGVGTEGAYPLAITATNTTGTATQNFTLTVPTAPAVTSANSTTFAIGVVGTFTVTATGTPAPTLAQSGALPTGVTFNTGTGVLGGTPAVGTSGTYPLVITATNAGGTATQNFTLTVGTAPAITSANITKFDLGVAGTFTVTATGTPSPTLALTGTLPSGVTFDTFTGILSGTPAVATGGTYPLVITATNIAGTANQNFTLTVRSEFAYVSNSNSNNIWAYSVDQATGALTPVAGNPFAAGSEPNSVGIHPSGRFLYVSNESTSSTLPSTVSAFTIDPATGALAQIAGSPYAAGIEPNTARVHPSGNFLYVPNEGDQTISAYAIDSATGALTAITGSPFVTGATGNTDSIAMNPAGTFAYVSQNSSPGAVLGFAINTTTGALTPVAGSPFVTGTNSDFTYVDPSGKFLYVANFGSMDVSGFTIDATTGALTAIAGSPFATGGGRPDAIYVDATGKYLYAADDSGVPAIAGFAIDSTTGALTLVPGSPFAAGNSPSGVTVDPNSRFAFSANENSGDVTVFTIDSSTGTLTVVTGSPFAAGTEPGGIAIAQVP